MKIILPVATPTPVTIRDDWQSVLIVILDDPVKKEVRVVIPGTPSVPKLQGTVTLPILVWSGSDYDKAQALNNNEGWGQSDLISAVECILNKLSSK